MAAFVREIRAGHSALEKFGTIVNSPIISSEGYQDLVSHLHHACGKTAEISMLAAADELKEEIGEDVMVSIDGTWQRRGHSSRNGIVTTIGAANNKVLDVEILSNYCSVCAEIQRNHMIVKSIMKARQTLWSQLGQ